METIKFALNICPHAAVRAGKLRYGRFAIAPTEEQIGMLSARERDVLAVFVWDEKGNSYTTTLSAPDDQPEPTWDALVSALRLEVAERDKAASAKAEDEARKVAENEATIAAVLAAPAKELTKNTYGSGSGIECAYWHDMLRIDWSDARLAAKRAEVDAYVQAVCAEARERHERIEQEEKAAKALSSAEKQERETRFSAAAKAFLAEYGTDNQRARHKEGLLPQRELVDLIRERVFARLDAFDRYAKINADDIDHSDDCDHELSPKYMVDAATELDADDYARLSRIRKAAPDGAEVEARKHVGVCTCCTSDRVYKRSALVSVEWHGRKLSREYAI